MPILIHISIYLSQINVCHEQNIAYKYLKGQSAYKIKHQNQKSKADYIKTNGWFNLISSTMDYKPIASNTTQSCLER